MSRQEITVEIGDVTINLRDIKISFTNDSSSTGSTPTAPLAIEPAAPVTTEPVNPAPATTESVTAEPVNPAPATTESVITAPATAESVITEPVRIKPEITGVGVERVSEPPAVAIVPELLCLREANGRQGRTIIALLVGIVVLLATLIGVVCWNQHESQERADKTDKSITSIKEDAHDIRGNTQEIAGTLKAIQDDKPVVLDWAPLYGSRDKGHKDGYVSLVQTSKERAATGLDGAYGVTIGTDSYQVVVTGPHTADGTINAYVQDKNGTHVVNLTADELNPNGEVKIIPIPLLSDAKLIKVTVEHLNDGPIVLKP